MRYKNSAWNIGSNQLLVAITKIIFTRKKTANPATLLLEPKRPTIFKYQEGHKA